jgi:flagellar biogenesis protein FliO
VTQVGSLAQPEPIPLTTGDWWQGLFAALLVLGLLAVLVMLAKRGALGGMVRGKGGPIQVETVLPIGERRSLLIVAVEGRRLLVGASPVNVALVTELDPRPPFDNALERASRPAPERRP